MIVSIIGGSCYVYRQDSDPVFRPTSGDSSWSAPGWYGAESRLLHHVQKTLNQRGYDLIKKRMWKDGHMVGTEYTQYLRSRDFQTGAEPLHLPRQSGHRNRRRVVQQDRLGRTGG